MNGPEKQLHMPTREAWHAWLEEHHADEREVWLVYHKKDTGRPNVPYDDALDEALCFGWIDSLIKKLDEERYARKFTPRTGRGTWSAVNKARVARLEREGRLTEAGRRVIEEAKRSGAWDNVPAGELPWEMPAEFETALAASDAARTFFEQLPPSHRKRYIGWIASARQSETRARRAADAIQRLEKNEPLGLK